MSIKENKLSKRTALSLVAAVIVIIMILILIRGASSKKGELSTLDARQAYLAELGWEIDPYSEECRRVQIPDCSEGVMEDYNRLQLAQGYDLREHSGESCMQYNYVITNYPGYDQTVYVTLYLQKGNLIAGDIHTAAVNGFMHELKRTDIPGKT